MKGPSIPSAKLRRPTTTGVLPRERLFDRLDASAGRPLSWISAPAGSGKTVLLASYLEARRLPGLWYRVDGGDADLASFFHHLALAARRAAPRRRRPLPALTPEYGSGVSAFSREFFTQLFERLRPPTALVFDDCHLVDDAAPMYTALLEAVGCLPEGMRLLCASRADPPAAFARLRAQRQLDVVSREDLKLTVEEFAAIVRRRGVDVPANKVLASLHRRLDGWAAGLQLVLEASQSNQLERLHLSEAPPEELFDYFSGEVLAGLDPGTRRFLLQTAFLTSMTPEMAKRLTGHARADRVLAHLYRRNYFTERQAEPTTYRYHPLFREFLLDKAAETFSSAETVAVQRRAAALLVEAGELEAAAELMAAAADWNGLGELASRHAEMLLRQGRSAILESWLRRMPGELLEADAWLQLWLGAALLGSVPAAAREHCERSFALFGEQGNNHGRVLAWCGVTDAILWGFDEIRAVEPWLGMLPELVGENRNLPPPIADRLTATAYTGIALTNPAHRYGWENRAVEVARRSTDISMRAGILFEVISARQGDDTDTNEEALLREIRQVLRVMHLQPLARIQALYAEMFSLVSRGRYEEMLQISERILRLSQRTGMHLMDVQVLFNAVHAALRAGDKASARQYLMRMAAEVAERKLWDQAAYTHLLSRMALLEGDWERAARLAEQALEQTARCGIVYPILFCHLVSAEVAVETGHDGQAMAHIEEVLHRGSFSPPFVQSAHFLLAYRNFHRGDEAGAIEALRAAMQRAPFRLPYPLSIRQSVLAELCVRALEAGIAPQHVAWIVRTFELPAPPAAADWPWPLRLYTLGRFEVQRDGQALRFPRKAVRKPLELLQTLIALGGRGIRETQMSDILWPDADGDLAHRSFATTLYRLRKLLGIGDALELRDGRLSLNERRCWVDATAMESQLRRSESVANGASGADADKDENLIRKALALYSGPFLPGLDTDPCFARARERSRALFFGGVEALADRLERHGRWKDAVELCDRVLTQVDPAVESLYQRLIRSHQRLGQRAEALMVYRRCRAVLRQQLGAEPSLETRQLVEAVRAERNRGDGS